MRIERHCDELVQLPEWGDFIGYRPIFRDLEDLPEIHELFNRIVTPRVFFESRAFSMVEIPAVTAIGDICLDWAKTNGRDWEACNRERQLCGSATCLFMESNGGNKKIERNRDLKRSVPHRAFTKAQVYEFPKPDHN